jgi:hypothetical protein
MPQPVDINGKTIQYPIVGESEWGVEATDFAVQVAGALAKIGQSTPPATNNITIPSGNLTVTTGNTDLGGTLDVTGATNLDSTLDVTGATNLDGTLTVAGTTTLNGNTNIGNANSDTIAVTGILNVDSGTLYVNPTDNRVGINDSSPSEALDVTGNALISGTLGVTGDVITSIVKASGSGGLTIDSNSGTDVALFGAGGGSGTTLYGGLNGTTATFSGVIYADDDTTANTPVISFTGDTNTGIGRSAADTLDFITGGVPRARISSTGLQFSVIPDLSGSNTNLFSEYKCRAWVSFNGTTATPSTIRGSGNVSSVTKNGTGDYTVNIDNDMPDANYSVAVTVGDTASPNPNRSGSLKTVPNVGSFTIVTGVPSTGSNQDMTYVFCEVFR